MKRQENVGFIEAIAQLEDYYSPQVESLHDQVVDLKRENRELRRLNNRSIWRIIKDRLIERLAK
jgi:hypothetical protein